MVTEKNKSLGQQCEEGEVGWIEMGVEQCLYGSLEGTLGVGHLGFMGQTQLGTGFCAAQEVKVTFIFLNDLKISKESYFMTCENDMKLRFQCL